MLCQSAIHWELFLHNTNKYCATFPFINVVEYYHLSSHRKKNSRTVSFLTYFMSLISFYTPWKHEERAKTADQFCYLFILNAQFLT